MTYRFRGHSMADPEQYRSKEEVARWRERDPIPVFAGRLQSEGVLDEAQVAELDEQAVARVDAAVAFAEASPFPAPESLYDDVYVLGRAVRGWYSIETSDGRTSGAPAGTEEPSANDEIPQQLTHALAASDDALGDDSGEAAA